MTDKEQYQADATAAGLSEFDEKWLKEFRGFLESRPSGEELLAAIRKAYLHGFATGAAYGSKMLGDEFRKGLGSK